MPKPNKSSASSGTRKKHAARKAATTGTDPTSPSTPNPTNAPHAKLSKKAQKAQAKNAPPRIKQYIPPTKPQPVQRDPLDARPELRGMIPGDVVVVLRGLGKKAGVTRGRAVGELMGIVGVGTGTGAAASKDGDGGEDGHGSEEEREDLLRLILPIWTHHLPSLLIHPDKRIRTDTLAIHAQFLSFPSVRKLFEDEYGEDEVLLGCWSFGVFGEGGASGRGVWEDFVCAEASGRVRVLSEVVKRTILDPMGTWTTVHPPAPSQPPPPTPSHGSSRNPHLKGRAAQPPKTSQRATVPASAPAHTGTGRQSIGGDGGDEDEDEADRKARLRVCALGVLSWVAGRSTPSSSSSSSLSSLSPLGASGSASGASGGEGREDAATHDPTNTSKSPHEVKDTPITDSTPTSTANQVDLLPLLSSPHFWSTIYPNADCSFLRPPHSHSPSEDDVDDSTPSSSDLEVIGFEQPLVRRAAWGVVAALVRRGYLSPPPTPQSPVQDQVTAQIPQADIPDHLQLASTAILRSAWKETDTRVRNGVGSEFWEGVLLFLRGFPRAWVVEATWDSQHCHVPPADEDEDADEEEGQDPQEPPQDQDQIQQPPTQTQAVPSGDAISLKAPNDRTSLKATSEAYASFLAFLSTGCAGAPLQGYPAVLVVLSGVPDEILFPAQDLITSLWTVLSTPSVLEPSVAVLPPPPIHASSSARPTPTPTPAPAPALTPTHTPTSKRIHAQNKPSRPQARAVKAPVQPGTAWATAVLECVAYVYKRAAAGNNADKMAEVETRGEREQGEQVEVDDMERMVLENVMGVWEECILPSHSTSSSLPSASRAETRGKLGREKGIKCDRETVVRAIAGVVMGLRRPQSQSQGSQDAASADAGSGDDVAGKLENALGRRIRDDLGGMVQSVLFTSTTPSHSSSSSSTSTRTSRLQADRPGKTRTKPPHRARSANARNKARSESWAWCTELWKCVSVLESAGVATQLRGWILVDVVDGVESTYAPAQATSQIQAPQVEGQEDQDEGDSTDTALLRDRWIQVLLAGWDWFGAGLVKGGNPKVQERIQSLVRRIATFPGSNTTSASTGSALSSRPSKTELELLVTALNIWASPPASVESEKVVVEAEAEVAVEKVENLSLSTGAGAGGGLGEEGRSEIWSRLVGSIASGAYAACLDAAASSSSSEPAKGNKMTAEEGVVSVRILDDLLDAVRSAGWGALGNAYPVLFHADKEGREGVVWLVDALVDTLLTSSGGGDEEEMEGVDWETRKRVVFGVVRYHELFMPRQQITEITRSVIKRFEDLSALPFTLLQEQPRTLNALTSLLCALLDTKLQDVVQLVKGSTKALGVLLVCGMFASESTASDGEREGDAREIWESLLPVLKEDEVRLVRDEVVGVLRGCLRDSHAAEDVLSMLSKRTSSSWGVQITVEDVLPSSEEVDAMYAVVWDWVGQDSGIEDRLDSLRVLHKLIPPPSLRPSASSLSSSKHASNAPTSTLSTPYVQAVLSLVYDRQIPQKKGNEWMIRHVLILESLLGDILDVGLVGDSLHSSVSLQSALYHEGGEGLSASLVSELGAAAGEEMRRDVEEMYEVVRRVGTYLLLKVEGSDTKDVHAMGDQLLRLGSKALSTSLPANASPSQSLIQHILTASTQAETQFASSTPGSSWESALARNSRLLSRVLARFLSAVPREDADKWTRYARSIERTFPNTALALLSAVNTACPSAPLLDRYRNELAASLLGVKPREKESVKEGLGTLWKLNAVAPGLEDADVVFLPTPRAVNLMKVCEKWVSGGGEAGDGGDDGEEDETEVGDEVECEMTAVFVNVAAILQSVPGSHWAFVFDLVESNLEACEFEEEKNLVTLSRTLKLLSVIQDLVETNKALREDYYQEKERPLINLVRNMVTSKQADSRSRSASLPRSVCHEQALSIVQALPDALIEGSSLSTMCHLLSSTSTVQVQKMAYRICQIAAKKRTENLVIEAGVDTQDTFKADVPGELLQVIGKELDLDGMAEDDKAEQVILGYLLGWMIIFDMFHDASFRVKSDFVDQLKAVDAVSGNLIPTLLAILGLDRGPSSAFKLDVWGVDEYHVQGYELGTLFGTQVLAAHVYFRALVVVPSLVYSWITECKDRQLSAVVHSYTSAYFSPILISTELAELKDSQSQSSPPAPSATEATSNPDGDLVDENFSVKVFSSINEVVASYLVDDHHLEIKLKVPGTLPLQRIEVREVRKVGVDETRWRAWMLAVQQIIWSRNGSIADALRLFKKNVTSHFAGQVECAICYSTISMIDGQLPRKPCKTCKNKFHSGCLYKWFNSSHSSSCPLCRSDIL